MAEQYKNYVIDACRHLLRPVVRFLLKAGVTHKEFSEVCKSVYVDVASLDYGLRGRPTNISRVAILTGLTRREVKRQRELDAEEHSAAAASKWHPATRVLSAWHQDPEFLDDEGAPRVLALNGKEASFSTLLRRYRGDVPESALMKELERIKAIELMPDDLVRVLRRSYVPPEMNFENLQLLGTHMHDLGTTIYYNLHRGDENPPRFERVASNRNVSPRAAAALRKLVARDSQQLRERFDDWMSEHEVDGDTAQGDGLRAGVGIYFFEDAAGGSRGDE